MDEQSLSDSDINEAVRKRLHPGWGDPDIYTGPDYCHSIEAAWEIVEAWRSKVDFELYGQENRHYTAWFKYQDGPEYFAEADTAPMAICLAFLKLP